MKFPIELFDGFDPEKLWFVPSDHGFDDLDPVELLGEANKKYRSNANYEFYRKFYNNFQHRVIARDKSSNRDVEIDGYFGTLKNKTSGNVTKAVLFSFFEVSPMRYNAYLHKIIDIEDDPEAEQGAAANP